MTVPHKFVQYFAWTDCQACGLDVQFDGATQCGRLNDHNNNQDALALWSRDACIVGVVSDGCGGSAVGQSNTEVGARLTAMLAAEIVGRVCLNGGVNQLSSNLPAVEEELCDRIVQIVDTLGADREACLHTFFMATLLGVAVDAGGYSIFGCGDGVFAIDGQVRPLSSESGNYLAGRLLGSADWRTRLRDGDPSLRVHASGGAQGWASLMIGSDGFEDITSQFPQLMGDYLATRAGREEFRGESRGLVEDFRRRVWMAKEAVDWQSTQDGHDDRSFILVRSFVPEASTAVSKSGNSSC